MGQYATSPSSRCSSITEVDWEVRGFLTDGGQSSFAHAGLAVCDWGTPGRVDIVDGAAAMPAGGTQVDPTVIDAVRVDRRHDAVDRLHRLLAALAARDELDRLEGRHARHRREVRAKRVGEPGGRASHALVDERDRAGARP